MPPDGSHYLITSHESENFRELETKGHGGVLSYRHEEPATPQHQTAIGANEGIQEVEKKKPSCDLRNEELYLELNWPQKNRRVNVEGNFIIRKKITNLEMSEDRDCTVTSPDARRANLWE